MSDAVGEEEPLVFRLRNSKDRKQLTMVPHSALLHTQEVRRMLPDLGSPFGQLSQRPALLSKTSSSEQVLDTWYLKLVPGLDLAWFQDSSFVMPHLLPGAFLWSTKSP